MATNYSEEAQRARRVPDLAEVPSLYAAVGYGTCMEPEIPHGTCLVFSKDEPPEAGDVVGIWFRPEHVPAGQFQHLVKRLVAMPPVSFPFDLSAGSNCEPLVLVEMTQPARMMQLRASHIMAIHKCVGTAESSGDGTARYRLGKGTKQ